MLRAAKTSQDSVKWSEIPKNHKSREVGGYRWKVEARLNGKRMRRFFQHDESEKRDLCIKKFESLIEQQAKDDREILADSELLRKAASSQKKLESYGKTLTEAVDFYLEHLKASEQRDTTPIEKVIANFLEEKRREEVSELHLTDLRQRLARFSKSFPKRAIVSFTRNEISEWILSLSVGPQAKINQRRILHNLFQFVDDGELITSNPVSTAAKGIKVRRKKLKFSHLMRLPISSLTARRRYCLR